MSKKIYAVVQGRQPGLYSDWFGNQGAAAQVKGFTGAIFKSFPTRDQAVAWYQEKAGEPPRFESLGIEPINDPYPHAADLAAGKLVIYTDGACNGNPGPGGYGVVMLFDETRQELSGGFAHTTNNRMELIACIKALESIKKPELIAVYCDSSYVVNGLEKGWASRWRDNHWKRRQLGKWVWVKNSDLWERLLELYEQHTVEFIQIRGHSGIQENERCDQLAVAALTEPNLPPDEGFSFERDDPQNSMFDQT